MSGFPIQIDPRAIPHLVKWFAKRGTEGQVIRLGVKGGGCSGFEYVVRVDDRILPIDAVTEVEGLTLVCDEKSAKLLAGSTLTYSGNLLSGIFSFENPNAAKSCGCGTSFTPKNLG